MLSAWSKPVAYQRVLGINDVSIWLSCVYRMVQILMNSKSTVLRWCCTKIFQADTIALTSLYYALVSHWCSTTTCSLSVFQLHQLMTVPTASPLDGEILQVRHLNFSKKVILFSSTSHTAHSGKHCCNDDQQSQKESGNLVAWGHIDNVAPS